jgi:uncharacterized protein YjaG (DUF416 family)
MDIWEKALGAAGVAITFLGGLWGGHSASIGAFKRAIEEAVEVSKETVSTLEAFRTEVAKTYATKDELNRNEDKTLVAIGSLRDSMDEGFKQAREDHRALMDALRDKADKH